MKTKFFLSLILLLFAFGASNAQQIIKLNSVDAKKMIESKKSFVLLDVRTAGEVAQGHLANSINIDIHQEDAYRKIDKLDKNATYLVYCRTQNRSGIAVKYMAEHGFKSIYHLTEGFSGWSANNFPIVK